MSSLSGTARHILCHPNWLAPLMATLGFYGLSVLN